MPETNGFGGAADTNGNANTNTNCNTNMNTNNNNNNFNDDNYYCQRVVKELRKTLKQANSTFTTIRSYLDDYTQNQFHKTPKDLHEEWQKHFLQLTHPYEQKLIRDFEVMPDETHFPHLTNAPITKETLINEIQNAYLTLKVLEDVFDEVLMDRIRNKDRLLHDLNNKHKLYNDINRFFEQSHQHVGFDLQEIEEAMCKLNIPRPEVQPAMYNREAPVREWLLAREHLSVMQYLRALYAILVNKCAQ